MSRSDLTEILEWDRIGAWFNLLQKIVKNLLTESQVVELGSYKGESNVAIAAVLPAESSNQGIC
ncbi:hypothetical protein ACE1CI_22950 [Aerosakkonemataceae cyanobacterium BLCC-F50]|uniref:Class I SAM-dependent methyltransferase n=1 Tax=Floridaenema flaviceps BLCC-F50 TaxID=3153642 RepID=A0ABV4XVU1_9CYAN